MRPQAPVIALGLDSAEGSVVERLLDEGRLPNLAALRARGVDGRVRAEPDGFLSMVWPTLLTGRSIGAHGWYFNKLWSHEDQRLRYLDASWIPNRAFWDDLGPGFRSAILDVPFSPRPAPEFDGLYLNGWQAHDDFGDYTSPAGFRRELRRRFGRPAMGREIFGPQSVRTLERQLAEAVDSLGQFARIVADVLARERWDLTLAVFGGVHRATHYLWSLDEADMRGASPEQIERLESATVRLMEAADRAVGHALEAAPADARVVVFALHGMGPNRGWSEHFRSMVTHLHARGADAHGTEGLVYRLKKSIPWEWSRQVTRRLPSGVNHALVPLWSRGMYDWSSTRFFALPLDLNGYVRVNLKGREARGIVEPGAELEELLQELTEDFESLRDLRDGAPVVSQVDRVDELVGADTPRRSLLPDLIVRWTDRSVRGSPGVSSRYGEVRWDPAAPLPSGRSGNHVQGGWLIGAGPGIGRATLPSPVGIVDLTATLLDWMGAPIPDHLEGRPVHALTAGPAATR